MQKKSNKNKKKTKIPKAKKKKKKMNKKNEKQRKKAKTKKEVIISYSIIRCIRISFKSVSSKDDRMIFSILFLSGAKDKSH